MTDRPGPTPMPPEDERCGVAGCVLPKGHGHHPVPVPEPVPVEAEAEWCPTCRSDDPKTCRAQSDVYGQHGHPTWMTDAPISEGGLVEARKRECCRDPFHSDHPKTTEPDHPISESVEGERCGGSGRIMKPWDDRRGREFNNHPDSMAGGSITSCPGCPDCHPRPTTDCGVCGVPTDMMIGVCEGYAVPRCPDHLSSPPYQAESRLRNLLNPDSGE